MPKKKYPSDLPQKERAKLPPSNRCGATVESTGEPCKAWASPHDGDRCQAHLTDETQIALRDAKRDEQRVTKPVRVQILSLAPEEIMKIDFSTQRKVERFCEWLSGILLEGRLSSAIAAQVLGCVKVALMSREIAIGEELARLEALIMAKGMSQ